MTPSQSGSVSLSASGRGNETGDERAQSTGAPLNFGSLRPLSNVRKSRISIAEKCAGRYNSSDSYNWTSAKPYSPVLAEAHSRALVMETTQNNLLASSAAQKSQIISYTELVTRDQQNLQKGMNYRTGERRSILAAFLRWLSKFAALVGGLLESGVEVGRKSLKEVKFELSESLRTLQAPLLVVIDDVDRLIPAEVQEFFNSSKSMPTSRISFTCSSLIEPRSKRMSRKCFQ